LLGRSSIPPEGLGGATGLPGPKESNRKKLLLFEALGLSPNREEVDAALGLKIPPKSDVLLESFEVANDPKAPKESKS
jgi:hypothetical protein